MSSDNSDTTLDDQPTGKRWDPLGANDLDDKIETLSNHFESSICLPQCFPYERVRALEEEQEFLNASLFQLTTHFAQVQFRLRQVVDAPMQDKEHLLKSLEEFAFRGVTDTCNIPCMSQDSSDRNEINRLTQRHKQIELIEQLRSQLSVLEKYTFVSGNGHNIPEHANEDRSDGDGASAMSSLQVKEQLVTQFKAQIVDLERFIEFLQDSPLDSSSHSRNEQCTCSCPVHGSQFKTIDFSLSHSRKKTVLSSRHTHEDEVRNRTIEMMKQAATLLQMFIVMHFGCRREQFKRNNLKSSFNHWGDLRARLEVTVTRVEELVATRNATFDEHQGEEYMSDTEESPFLARNVTLIASVRRHLAVAIRDLLQHGLTESIDKVSVVPFITCFPTRSAPPSRKAHPWELILQYYHLKNGAIYNSTPARKLSQSFNLEIAEGQSISNKHHMLGVIGSIITTHSEYKRSYDAHFKAFVCAALNCHRLIPWLRLLVLCKPLVKQRYNSWSYVIRTGFKDSLESLDRLTPYNFDLPVDLAIRHFQNIKDAF